MIHRYQPQKHRPEAATTLKGRVANHRYSELCITGAVTVCFTDILLFINMSIIGSSSCRISSVG